MKTFMLIVVSHCLLATLAFGGNLEPSGPPAGTMKPLDQVEPRTAITSVPLTISQSGSYYLTKNLTATGTAITVNADDVTIDLCGFKITGPGLWGSIYGIYSSGRKNIEVRNGIIKGFGYAGVYSGGSGGMNCRVIGVTSADNAVYGIYMGGTKGIVKDCVVYNNGTGLTGYLGGIYVQSYSVVSGNIVYGNGNSTPYNSIPYGIHTGAGCVVEDNKVYDNGINSAGAVQNIWVDDDSRVARNTVKGNTGTGIHAGQGSTVEENTVNRNTGDGIEMADHCRAKDNVVLNNGNRGINAGMYSDISGCTANSNTHRGIYAGDYSTITNCTVSRNSQDGIWAMSFCTVTGNNAGFNQKAGIFCWSGKVIGNTVSNNNQADDSAAAGIVIWGESQVKENMALNNKASNIFIHYRGSTVENNSVRGSTIGIKFDDCCNYYAGNRASNNTTAYANTAGNTDGGGNVTF